MRYPASLRMVANRFVDLAVNAWVAYGGTCWLGLISWSHTRLVAYDSLSRSVFRKGS